ncbi:MAG TPA: HAD family hydrolase [Candidatus Eisenbacteria bacterium]|jgi:phosphoglycolate phosphatase-like HAD superfamily hydrolase
MKLVVFDLDGTLARTSLVDGECYAQSVVETLMLQDLDTDWTRYEHVTDEGILSQIFAERFGRLPTIWERDKILDRFLDLLKHRCAVNGAEFAEIPGAGALMTRLLDGAEWGTALATGGWRRSAELKIRRAELPAGDLPSAFAEDGPSREAIVQTAIERACRRYRQPSFERVVSVGDSLWDVRTARNLRLPFLGIAEGPNASVLRTNGASHVLPDYLDAARCLHFLDEARSPR